MWHAMPNLKSMLNYIPGSWLWTYQRISVFQVYISWAKACSHLVKGITWTSFFCRIPIPKDFSFSEELVFPDFYPIWAKGTFPTKNADSKRVSWCYICPAPACEYILAGDLIRGSSSILRIFPCLQNGHRQMSKPVTTWKFRYIKIWKRTINRCTEPSLTANAQS